MADFPLKDYQSAQPLTIVLNNLGIGGLVKSSTIINNQGTARFDEIEVSVTISAVNVLTGLMDGCLIPSLDGTTFVTIGAQFPVGSSSVPIASCPCDTGNSAKFLILRFQNLGPYQYLVFLRNSFGVALTTSGNSASWRGSLRETR